MALFDACRHMRVAAHSCRLTHPSRGLHMTDTNDTPHTPDPNQPLQFDRVVSETPGASMTCSSCGKPIVASYYDVDGKHVCLVCKEAAERGNEPARGVGTFFKALGLGLIASLLGAALYYGWVAITG